MDDQGTVTAAMDGRGVATVTVRHARKLNTMNPIVIAAFSGVFTRLSNDSALRAVVLEGEGARAFIGGADITFMATLDAESARTFITSVHRCCAAIRDCPVPVIARMRGHVLGAGMEVAAACDVRAADAGAKFGMPEVRIGIPSVIEAALLPSLIGFGRTRRLLYSGETISAETAEAWGFVDLLAEPDELDAAVERLVVDILAGGPAAMRIQKKLIRQWEDQTLTEAIEAGIDAFVTAWDTAEPRERMDAFMDALRARRRQK